MNRFVAVLVGCAVFSAVALMSQAAHAQAVLPEEQVNRIRQKCVTNQAALRQLHASDGLLRVNRGTLYENISTKLMAPLNSRITLDGLGGLKLTATTLEYNRQLNAFRASYKQYEESMTRTINIDCVDRPIEFYESITSTREKRHILHEDTRTLTTLLKAYKTEFESFAKEFEEGTE